LRNRFLISQIRQFSSSEKFKIEFKRFQTYTNSLIKNTINLNNLNHYLSLNEKNWLLMNRQKNRKSFKLKKLIIYPYSLSNNLLKEVLLKMGFRFVLTNEIRKANLIIGLKKHLKQNFKLRNLAKQKTIPIYSLNQISFYQISKLIKFLGS